MFKLPASHLGRSAIPQQQVNFDLNARVDRRPSKQSNRGDSANSRKRILMGTQEHGYVKRNSSFRGEKRDAISNLSSNTGRRNNSQSRPMYLNAATLGIGTSEVPKANLMSNRSRDQPLGGSFFGQSKPPLMQRKGKLGANPLLGKQNFNAMARSTG